MVKISAALSADGVVSYHSAEYAANYSAYYAAGMEGRAVGVWFGENCKPLGLVAGSPVKEEDFVCLANGQSIDGLQLIAWRPPPGEAQASWVENDSAWREYLTDMATVAAARKFDDFYERVDAAKMLLDIYEATPQRERAKISAELVERYGLRDDWEIAAK